MSKSFPWSCLGDDGVASIVAGQSPSSENYNMHGEGLPFYQGKSDFGHIYPVPRVWCTHPHKIAKRGDVLISVRAPVGDVNIANDDCAIGRGLAAVRAKNETDAPFLFFSLKHIKQKLMDSSTGSTFASINQSTLQNVDIPFPDKNMRVKIGKLLLYVYNRIEYESNLYSKTQIFKHACINTTKLKAFPVAFPGPDEQQEIVDILDAIDQKINLHRRKKVVLEELFKSLLHKLMTGEVRVDELDLSALAPQDKKEPDHVQ